MGDESPYILYGSYASYATAEPRSYLRKKGIPLTGVNNYCRSTAITSAGGLPRVDT